MGKEQLKESIQDILIDDSLFKALTKKVPSFNAIVEINSVAIKYKLPKQILIGVYILERTFRPVSFRVLEYLALFYSFIMLCFFRKPFPNYTIGICQVGIGNILNFNGYNVNAHSTYTNEIHFKQFIAICKSIYWKQNIEIAAWLLKKYYEAIEDLSFERKIKYVGMAYNGDYSYGQMLKNLICNSQIIPKY